MPNTTSTNDGVFLTVPANTLWTGYIVLAGALAAGSGVQSQQTATPFVLYNGTGGNMNDGDILARLALATPAQLVGAVAGASNSNSIAVGPMSIQARANPITLTLKTGSATIASATAVGEM